MSRVQLGFERLKSRGGRRVLFQALRGRASETSAGLRELRHYRPAAETDLDGGVVHAGSWNGSRPQPPRNRGRRVRRCGRRRRAAEPDGTRGRGAGSHDVLLRPPGQGLGQRSRRRPWEIYTCSPTQRPSAGMAGDASCCVPVGTGAAEDPSCLLLSGERSGKGARPKPPCGGASWPNSWGVASWPLSSSAPGSRHRISRPAMWGSSCRECRGNGGGPFRHHLDVRPGLGWALQSDRLHGRCTIRRPLVEGYRRVPSVPRPSAASAGPSWPTPCSPGRQSPSRPSPERRDPIGFPSW